MKLEKKRQEIQKKYKQVRVQLTVETIIYIIYIFFRTKNMPKTEYSLSKDDQSDKIVKICKILKNSKFLQ